MQQLPSPVDYARASAFLASGDVALITASMSALMRERRAILVLGSSAEA